MKATAARDVAGQFNYRNPREGNETHRWRCMKRNMRHDDRLDKAAGQRLLDAARKLQGCTATDWQELLAEFNERFGSEDEHQEPQGRYR